MKIIDSTSGSILKLKRYKTAKLWRIKMVIIIFFKSKSLVNECYSLD